LVPHDAERRQSLGRLFVRTLWKLYSAVNGMLYLFLLKILFVIGIEDITFRFTDYLCSLFHVCCIYLIFILHLEYLLHFHFFLLIYLLNYISLDYVVNQCINVEKLILIIWKDCSSENVIFLIYIFEK